ncbi:unnamed protein product [Brachionus calyciflorus]|uniref:Uncharacterized protein n=1 Tax=Brachionus calyciflorus TaxID=104777 RepID=A0A814B515_9BILA|nr:unnamed protein product [Brachionus calyciflorus]
MEKLDESELEELGDEVSEMNTFRKRSKRADSTSSNEDDDEIDKLKPRVERFLSIAEIPPDILLLQQKLEIQARKNSKTNKEDLKKSNKINNKSNKNIHHYHNGSSLSRAERAKIIKDIIKNFDLEKYISDFNEKDVIEVKLDKNKPENRAVRERMVKLMKSDVIRINDINFMRELSDRIQESYQNEQKKVLKELEEKEIKRQRNLIARGLLDEPYDF